MIKKYILLLILFSTLYCSAQIPVGDWKIHPVFGSNITKIIDTQDMVYYLVDKSLYCYDKNNDENNSFTKRNLLSDIGISKIFYNYEKKYLLIAYENSNLDFLYDDGKLVNFPDIKDVVLTSSKKINDINFSNNGVFVATDFGYLILNDEKFEVTKSQIFNIKINTIIGVGKKIVLGSGTKLYVGDIDKVYSSLSAFTATNVAYNTLNSFPISDNSFILNIGQTLKVVINENNTLSTSVLFNINFKNAEKTKTGFFIQPGDTNKSLFYKLYDKDFNEIQTVNLPESLQKSAISSFHGNDQVWAIDLKGLKKVKLADDKETILIDYFKPDASTVNQPFNTVYNKGLNKLYVMNTGPNEHLVDYGVLATINTLDGSFWEDVTPEFAPTTLGAVKNNKLNDPYQPVFDPDDPTIYYVGSWYEGFYKVKDNKVVAKYDNTNSPIQFVNNWYCCIPSLQFDKDKNLWVFLSQGKPLVFVLPRAKQSQATLTAADWYTPTISGFSVSKKMHFIITKKDNLKIVTEGNFTSVLTIFDDNGTPGVYSDDRVKNLSSLIDQDEKNFTWNFIHSFLEDANGRLWVGTSNGIIEINPANAFNSNFRINRIKVPRNDGTQFADYLLENIDVTCMAIDGSNRKWIGTLSSGVFLVSEDGSQILKHFTTSNSYLIHNQIGSISCNPNTNSVYIGTPIGLVEYSSDAISAEDNYENVYAYPNPVRPDYTGLITVRGLMDNSLVKIADTAGNVFYSTRSVGGMITWDGCASTGERVKTGVYHVLASQGENESSSGIVTKILIVN